MSSKQSSTPVYAKASRWYIYIRSIFPILLGLGMVGYGAYDLMTHKRIPYNPENSTKSDEQGEIVDVNCTSQGSCVLNVKYSVNGIQYQTSYTNTTPSTYKKGNNVDVYVDTKNHSRIVLIGDSPTLSPWILVGFGSLFVLLPIINNYFVSKSDTLATTETIFSIASR
jgi:hypothetical protein